MIEYMIEYVIISFWIICGIIAYGYMFPMFRDVKSCIFLSLFGPIILFIIVGKGDYKHGWKIRFDES